MALTQVTSIGLKDGEIVNADLHSAASVALSKLASTGALGSAVTATTQSASDDSTKLATTAFVQAAVTSLIDGAPGSLNTLNELAAAINDDSSYATTLTTALATKAVLTGSTNNTIATVTGANALTGEANLTFDGTTLAVTGNTTISGNLTVQGDFTETVKIATEDPIIALNTAVTGSNTYDSGFVTERGSDTNVALIWDESEDLFNFITTTDTGVLSGNVNVSGQANIKTGNITSTGNLAIAGTLTGVTNLGLSGNLQFDSGQTVNEISTDATFTDGSATALVTEAAAKSYINQQASAFAIALG